MAQSDSAAFRADQKAAFESSSESRAILEFSFPFAGVRFFIFKSPFHILSWPPMHSFVFLKIAIRYMRNIKRYEKEIREMLKKVL